MKLDGPDKSAQDQGRRSGARRGVVALHQARSHVAKSSVTDASQQAISRPQWYAGSGVSSSFR